MTYVLCDKEVVKDRFEERPGDSIRRIDGGEGRGRKVRYRSLFRAGPWYRSYLELCAKQECEEAELEGKKKKKKKWKEVHAMSCWVGKDARESFLGKSSHVPALSDAANLLERSSLEKSYFLRHAAFPSLLLRSFQRSLLLLPIREIWLFDHSHISSRYDFDETIHRYFVNFTFHLFSWFISRIMKLHKVYSEVYIGVKDEFSKMD